MAKNVSDLIISFIFVGIFVTGISFIIAASTIQYNVSYDNTTFNNLDYLSEINETTQTLQNQTQAFGATQQNAFDIVGAFFNQGYTAVILTFQSLGYGFSIVTSISNLLSLDGPFFPYLVAALFTILVLTVIFIALRTVIKDQV